MCESQIDLETEIASPREQSRTSLPEIKAHLTEMWGEPTSLVMVVFFKGVNRYFSFHLHSPHYSSSKDVFFFWGGLIPGCFRTFPPSQIFSGAVPLLVLCFQEPELTLKRISALVTSVW